MKRFFFILLILTTGLATATKAQNIFSLEELEKLATSDSMAFDHYVLKKGYIINNEVSTKTTKTYKSQNQWANKQNDWIDRSSTGTGLSAISFRTTDSTYYKHLQDSLAHNGFKNIKNESVSVGEGTIVITRHYANKEFTVDLNPILAGVVMWYNVQVAKKPE
jgi:hypothetical protein